VTSARYRFDDEFRKALGRRFAGFRRQALEDRGALKHAAVAMALVADEASEAAALLLTRRTAALRSHAGQYAFPGGRVDEGESAVEAALREVHEELGLRLDPGQVVGLLDDYATRSGYVITPVVIWVAGVLELVPNPEEVAAAHRILLERAAEPHAFDFVRIAESDRPIIRFRFEDDFIHAPTAAILYQFAELLAGRCTRVAHLDQPVFAWR
jgi:8-oxo-dGTP pyrophosphatase MutT (NUDIX family)